MAFKIMGILNLTPDSFSDGNLYISPERAILKLSELISHKADIIDIGAESTNHNSTLISLEQELERLEPFLDLLKIFSEKNNLKNSNIKLSIDTRKAEIAELCLRNNFKYINDVSGLSDERIVNLIADFPESKIIICHNRGVPTQKENNPENLKISENLIAEINEFFSEKIKKLKLAGVRESQIILDIGLGFGKNTLENIFIIKNLSKISDIHRLPVLIGASRKRFVKNFR